ncbi:MAG: nucleotide exchange factor GrpE [Chloroflexota bacterium]|nr:nucleotide exchange factor GrpE [Chloroflexota bacterium]
MAKEPRKEADKEELEQETTEVSEGAAESHDPEVLRQALKEAEAKAAEYLDGWQRAQAEFANYKKRNEKERKELFELANAILITRLLPILDDFERAFQTLPRSLASLTWVDGIALIYRKMQATFEEEGVSTIETERKSFDPRLHEAVSYEESEGHEEGQIIGEVQKGYKLHDRILRPALVRVAKGKLESETEEET